MNQPFTYGAWSKPVADDVPRCIHCKAKPPRRAKSRGVNRLCSLCIRFPDLRALYELPANGDGVGQEPDPRPERKPGDKLWWCFWCRNWLCDQPLKLCFGCQKEYEAAMEAMPARIKLGEVRGSRDS